MAFYGWIINTQITGQIVAVETKDRLSFSGRPLGPVTGFFTTTEVKDRWSSAGFEIPIVKPPAPVKRRLLIVT